MTLEPGSSGGSPAPPDLASGVPGCSPIRQLSAPVCESANPELNYLQKLAKLLVRAITRLARL